MGCGFSCSRPHPTAARCSLLLTVLKLPEGVFNKTAPVRRWPRSGAAGTSRRSHPDRPPLFNFEHCLNFKSRVSELGQHPLVRPRNRSITVHGSALESAAPMHSGGACPHDGARQPHTGAGDHVGASARPATASTSGISRTRRADAKARSSPGHSV
jgi:hypothetical protein